MRVHAGLWVGVGQLWAYMGKGEQREQVWIVITYRNVKNLIKMIFENTLKKNLKIWDQFTQRFGNSFPRAIEKHAPEK